MRPLRDPFTLSTKKYLHDNFEIKGTVAVNPDGKFDVNGSVFIKSGPFNRSRDFYLDIEFGEIMGSFNVFHADIRHLRGFPEHVNGKFQLDTLADLTSLKGAPAHVGSLYIRNGKNLHTLKHCPHVLRDIQLDTLTLNNLEGLPAHVKGGLSITMSTLKQTTGAPRHIDGTLDLTGCSQQSFPNLHTIGGLKTSRSLAKEPLDWLAMLIHNRVPLELTNINQKFDRILQDYAITGNYLELREQLNRPSFERYTKIFELGNDTNTPETDFTL